MKDYAHISDLFDAIIGLTANIDEIKQMVADGVDVNILGPENKTPLAWLCEMFTEQRDEQELCEIASVLLAAGAKVNARADGNFTPIMGAVYSSQPQLVKLLIQHGADLDTTNIYDERPLDFAMKDLEGKKPEDIQAIIKTLADKGADLEYQSATDTNFLTVGLEDIEEPGRPIYEKIKQYVKQNFTLSADFWATVEKAESDAL